MLIQSGYDREKTKFVVDGFKERFELNYQGSRTVKRTAPNLKIQPGVGSKVKLWNKVMKEVKVGQYTGPFKIPPFDFFIQSPIGLVPKDNGTKTRLIFHLSYPRRNAMGGPCVSVNAGIPKDSCTVKYPTFDEAVQLCLSEGKTCKMAKSDMSMAFRHTPIKRKDWMLLFLKATHPVTQITYFFCDKCLPFGSSTSCAIFQQISDAIAHLVFVRTLKRNINYLDNYFFVMRLQVNCDQQVKVFLWVCQQIQFPVSMDKTVFSSAILVFLGLLLDTDRQIVCIPYEKAQKALDMIAFVLNQRNRKVTIHQLQKLTGYFNFLCQCVIPGRAFTQCMYALTSGNLLLTTM